MFMLRLACIDTSSLRRSSQRANAWGGPSILWAFPKHLWACFRISFLYVRTLYAIRRQFCMEKSRWEFEFCPLSGIEKRPLLRGCFSITTVLISIRNTELVRCREVVRFSESPLSEARLLPARPLCTLYVPPRKLLHFSACAMFNGQLHDTGLGTR